MGLQAIWDNDRIGDPEYLGLSLGGLFSGATLTKADYPGLRAVRLGGVVTLARDLPDSYSIPVFGTPVAAQTVEATDQTAITSTTFAAGSPVCGLAFVAPESGAVWVTVGGFLQIGISANVTRRTVLSWELRQGSTVGSGTVLTAANDIRAVAIGIGATSGLNATGAGSFRFLETGLTPGSPYNVRTMHRVDSTSASGQLSDRQIAVEEAPVAVPLELLY